MSKHKIVHVGINFLNYTDYKGIRFYRYQASFDNITKEKIEEIAHWLINTFNFQDIDVYETMKGWIIFAWHNYYFNKEYVLFMRDKTPMTDNKWKRLNPEYMGVRCSEKYEKIKDIKHYKTIKGRTVPFSISVNGIEISSEEMFEIGEKEKRRYEKWIS